MAIVAIAVVVIGVFVFRNQGGDKLAQDMPQQDVQFSVKRDGNAVVLASDSVKDGAPVVEIFEDFSCPHCRDLVDADHEDTLKALNDGDVTVRLNFLNFLDRQGPASSTRGAAVALKLAETGNAKAFWNLHNYAMLEQAKVARGWGYEDFSKALQAYDLDQSVLDAISNGSVQDAAMDVAKANADELQKRVQGVSSPVVFVDGKEYQVKAGPDGKPLSWVPDVVK